MKPTLALPIIGVLTALLLQAGISGGVGLGALALIATLSMFFAIYTLYRRASAFFAPERERLVSAIARSATHGPMASGLVPIASFVGLMLLLVFANTGIRP